MAAKIGILGEGTATTTGTVTLYTVPADKAARIRILFALENAASTCAYSVLIGTPGTEIQFHHQPGSGIDLYSGVRRQSTPDPADAFLASIVGMQLETGGIELANLTSGNPMVRFLP
jgi:hypothetical protein